MSFEPVKKSTGSGVDWSYVNEQIEDCMDQSNDARVAVLVDLGVHDQGARVNNKGVTMVLTEDEALDLIERAEDALGTHLLEKDGLDEYEQIEGIVYKLDFKIVKDQWVFPSTAEVDNATYFDTKREAKEFLALGKKLDKYNNLDKAGINGWEQLDSPFKLDFAIYDGGEQREFGILVDLVDTEVEYIKDSDDFVNYRVNLCSVFEGKMQGFISSKEYGTLSLINKLCKATGNKHILKDTGKMADLVGSPFFQVLEKKGDFVNFSKNFGTPRTKDLKSIAPLAIEGGVVIKFEDVTVKKLNDAKLNKLYVDRIKASKYYAGTRMQEMLEKWEATRNESTSNAEAEEEDFEEEEEDEAQETPPRTSGRKAKASAKIEEEDDDEDSEEEEEAPKPKSKRRVRKVKEEEPEAEEAPRRKRKEKKAAPQEEEEQEEEEEAPKPERKRRVKKEDKPQRNEPTDDDDDPFADDED